MKSERRVRLKKEERRDQILEVAKTLFAANGYENSTAKDIAEFIGISETLIFQLFGSKDGIYKVLFARWAEEEKKVIHFNIIDHSALKTLYTIAEDMIHECNLIFESSGRDSVLAKAIYNRYAYEDERVAAISEGSDIVADSLMPVVIYGQISGEIREGNPRELASSFSAWITGVVSRKNRYSKMFIVPSIDLALDMLRKRT